MYSRSLLPLALLPALGLSSPLLNSRSYSGPVLQDNLPDPSLIQVGDTWYSFATGGVYATSTDFNTWESHQPANLLTKTPAWATPSAMWAPDVIALPNDGGYVMYFTFQANNPNAGSDKRTYHCVGAGFSKNITGPYEPQDAALACPISQGGAIDASGFVDQDGSIYAVYKVDGNNIGSGGNCGNGNGKVPTPIMLQKMKADGVTPDGDAQKILDHDKNDGPLVEAPSLARKDNTYFLFFSSNCYSGGLYDSSYAVSKNGIGNGGSMYTKALKPNAPLLKTGKLYSPGGLSIAADGQHVAFHADKGQTADVRQLYVGTVTLDSDKGIVTI